MDPVTFVVLLMLTVTLVMVIVMAYTPPNHTRSVEPVSSTLRDIKIGCLRDLHYIIPEMVQQGCLHRAMSYELKVTYKDRDPFTLCGTPDTLATCVYYQAAARQAATAASFIAVRTAPPGAGAKVVPLAAWSSGPV